MSTILTIGLSDAREVIDAAARKADEIGQPMVHAIVDAGGNLVAVERQDGAWLGSIDIAINKAYTARAFDMETAKLGQFAQPGSPAFGIQHSNSGRIMVFAGGFPLRRDGQVVGAYGVSGGYGEQDEAVGEAAVAAYQHLAAAA